jgi:hypothetical protein
MTQMCVRKHAVNFNVVPAQFNIVSRRPKATEVHKQGSLALFTYINHSSA